MMFLVADYLPGLNYSLQLVIDMPCLDSIVPPNFICIEV